MLVAVAALAMVGTLPGRTQGLGLITEPLMRDLGIGRVAYAQVNLSSEVDDTESGQIGRLVAEEAPQVDGLEVLVGGEHLATIEPPETELIGLAFAVIVLIVAFGSVLAMGLPIAVAVGGVVLGLTGVALLTNVATVPEDTTLLGLMIGLGVGIDYALLIVTRYREQLHSGHDVRESISIAMDTAGRSVLFAGTTVVISLLGMLLMGVGFVQGLAVGAASVSSRSTKPSVSIVTVSPRSNAMIASSDSSMRGRCSSAGMPRTCSISPA